MPIPWLRPSAPVIKDCFCWVAICTSISAFTRLGWRSACALVFSISRRRASASCWESNIDICWAATTLFVSVCIRRSGSTIWQISTDTHSTW